MKCAANRSHSVARGRAKAREVPTASAPVRKSCRQSHSAAVSGLVSPHLGHCMDTPSFVLKPLMMRARAALRQRAATAPSGDASQGRRRKGDGERSEPSTLAPERRRPKAAYRGEAGRERRDGPKRRRRKAPRRRRPPSDAKSRPAPAVRARAGHRSTPIARRRRLIRWRRSEEGLLEVTPVRSVASGNRSWSVALDPSGAPLFALGRRVRRRRQSEMSSGHRPIYGARAQSDASKKIAPRSSRRPDRIEPNRNRTESRRPSRFTPATR